MVRIELNEFYQRQTILAEFGKEGQQKLLKAKILIVGCGGLGNAVAPYLAASGIGEITLVDFDVIQVSNLHRQVFFSTSEVGKLKVEVLRDSILKQNPAIKINAINLALNKDNAKKLIEDHDLVVDCTDSLPIKYLLNDVSVLLNKPLIYGSLYKFDGYVASFNLAGENGFTANLRDAFPKMPKDRIPNCSEVGTLNPIVGLIGLLQANEVIKVLSSVGTPLSDQLLVYNSLNNQQLKIKIEPKITQEEIAFIFENESYFDAHCEVQNHEWLISKTKFDQIKQNPKVQVISVLENKNQPLPFKADVRIPYSDFDPKSIEINPNYTYVLVCQKGITSYAATHRLKEIYPDVQILSLEKGIQQYG